MIEELDLTYALVWREHDLDAGFARMVLYADPEKGRRAAGDA